ncbi:GNAT family N-acetyltransferase [Alicyclobacillus macrosporangiidus]|uniref:GNAT family N-acetyltransferase n=1 Tax=Alicyclobacillus macrosporangiidus TaxID=392015 RepID=UPI0034E96FA5
MLDNPNIIVTARIDGQLVGIARATADYAYCSYLPDVAVDKEFQRAGTGKELVRLVREKLGKGTFWIRRKRQFETLIEKSSVAKRGECPTKITCLVARTGANVQ